MTSSRLYRELARKLAAEISAGVYRVGSRLPAERGAKARIAPERAAAEDDPRTIRMRRQRFKRATA